MEISAKIILTKELVKSVLTLSVPELLKLGFTISELELVGIVTEHPVIHFNGSKV